jgi:toxin ParE1/3/4
MMPLGFSRRADSDLDAAWDRIARSNVTAANRWLANIRKKFHFLSNHPEAGELCPDLGSGIRRLVNGNYAIYYQVVEDHLENARVIHAARDIKRAFDD